MNSFKCKQCGANIVRIDTVNGKMVCNAPEVPYWRSSSPNTMVLTPNGETVYCRLTGKAEKFNGLGYTLHTCFIPPPKDGDSVEDDLQIAEVITAKNCKLCGTKMIWENPMIKGHFHESSCNIDGWPICHECMAEHCCGTSCLACPYGTQTECHFHELKRHYMKKD